MIPLLRRSVAIAIASAAGASLGTLFPSVSFAQTATLGFSPTSVTVHEAPDSVATLSVRRHGNTNSAVTVNYATGNDTFDFASAGEDFAFAAGTLSFAPGETNKSVSIAIFPDAVPFEGQESLSVQLSSPSAGAVLESASLARVRIEDPSWPAFADGAFALDMDFIGEVLALARDADGHILVAGGFSSLIVRSNYAYRMSGGVARLHADGVVDRSFDPGVGADGNVYAVAAEANGAVLIGGAFRMISGVSRPYLARLHANGSLDTSFAPAIDNELRSIVVQPDGRIVIAGRFTAVNGISRGRVARLQANGSLDTSFTPGTGANSNIRTLALDSDGRLFIGGDFELFNGVPASFLAKLDASGALDAGFQVTPGPDDEVRTIAIQPDGRIVIGGDFNSVHGESRGPVARLNANGSLDGMFNPGVGAGVVRTVVVQEDGKLLLGGEFEVLENQFRLLKYFSRLNADGSLDTLFPGRDFNPQSTGFTDEVFSILPQQPNDTLLVGGQFHASNALMRAGLQRVYRDETRAAFCFDQQYASARESNAYLSFGVRRLGDLSGSVQVGYQTVNGSAVGGEDFVATDATLTFGPGEYLKQVTVPILNDDRREPGESFGIQLRPLMPGGALGVPAESVAFLADNDLGFSLSEITSPIHESATNILLTVSRAPDAVGAATVRFQTADGTARAGEDYLATNGILNFGVGETMKTFSVQILPDSIIEGTETLLVSLSDPAGSTDLGARTNLTLFIQDASGELGFDVNNFQVGEANGLLQLRVLRSLSGVGAVSVRYATRDGTAVAGADYVTRSGMLTFGEGEFVKTFTVPILEDPQSEPDETFSVVLSEPSTGASLAPWSAVATVSIRSNDRGFSFASTNLVTPEAETNLVVTVVRDGSEVGEASVQFVTETGTATPGADYVAAGWTLGFAPGQAEHSFVVTLLADCLPEPTERFTLSLRNPSPGAYLAGSVATVTIQDDDSPAPILGLPARGQDGSVQMFIRTPSGQRCVIDASSDLRQWQPILTNQLTSCVWLFSELNVPPTQRFYRARLFAP